jgi:hypothetical protein
MAYFASPGWWWWWEWSSRWNEWQGKSKYSEKTCPSAALSTTDPTWPDQGSNPGHRGGIPATNRMSYGTAARTACRGIKQLALHTDHSNHLVLKLKMCGTFAIFTYSRCCVRVLESCLKRPNTMQAMHKTNINLHSTLLIDYPSWIRNGFTRINGNPQ